MKNTHVVDTNVLLRYLLADHEAHFQQAAAFMEQVRRGKRRAYVTDAVIAECVYVLTKFYQVPRQEAAVQLEKLLGYKGVVGPHVAALREALRRFAGGEMAFVDALVVTIARENDAAVESFDKQVIAASRRE